ncbi:MAG: glycosyltransferase family 2 protein [Thermoleophilia bacterium]|nr:glycosyltransferase family 2 protein [Thermoleophilia bacterium]
MTVVLATWNFPEALRLSMASALAQTVDDIELLVVGDGCTDDTPDVVAAAGDGRARFIALEPRVGCQSGPNNRGVAEARAPFVAYLGHDDLWHPRHLEYLLDVQRERDADHVHGVAIAYGPPGTGVMAVAGLGHGLGLDRHPTVMPGATLHRREIAAAVGGWRLPHETRVPVDVDFAARVRARGYRCAHSRRATLFKFPSSSRRDVYVTRDVRQQTRVAGDLARDPDRAVEEGLAAVVEAFATGRGELSLESPPGTPGDVWRRAVRTKRSGPAAPRATVGAAEFSPEAGWSPLEVGAGGRPFRWTTGQAAHVVVPADGTADLDVEVGLAGAVTRAVRDTARITFGGRVLARGPDGEEGDVAVLRARAPATPGREAGLMISVVADAVCPRDAGLGDDPRTLGLAVAFVRASPAGGGAA